MITTNAANPFQHLYSHFQRLTLTGIVAKIQIQSWRENWVSRLFFNIFLSPSTNQNNFFCKNSYWQYNANFLAFYKQPISHSKKMYIECDINFCCWLVLCILYTARGVKKKCATSLCTLVTATKPNKCRIHRIIQNSQ